MVRLASNRRLYRGIEQARQRKEEKGKKSHSPSQVVTEPLGRGVSAGDGGSTGVAETAGSSVGVGSGEGRSDGVSEGAGGSMGVVGVSTGGAVDVQMLVKPAE